MGALAVVVWRGGLADAFDGPFVAAYFAFVGVFFEHVHRSDKTADGRAILFPREVKAGHADVFRRMFQSHSVAHLQLKSKKFSVELSIG